MKGGALMGENLFAQSSKLGMGTLITHEIHGANAQEALIAAEVETLRLERLLSRFNPKSDISSINHMAGIGEVAISDDTLEVLLRACEYSKMCNGCFDITVGPLVSLWASAKEAHKAPSKESILSLLPRVNYQDLLVDSQNKTAFLKKAGQSIDLGGTAKGYAADNIIEVYKNFGIFSAFTNFGGNVAVIGAKSDGLPWNIGIRHPRKKNRLIGVVSVTDQSVVTSGDYMRYFIGRDGKRYHHIIDPSSGYPAKSGLISATVITKSSMSADTLSTILFLSGLEKGIEILNKLSDTEAILIDTNLTVYITEGLRYCFQPSSSVKFLT